MRCETRTIELSRGMVAIVDAGDFDLLSRYKWHAHEAGSAWYAFRTSHVIGSGRKNAKRISVYMHREVIGAHSGQMVDHVNGDSLDNRRANLRFCTKRENALNSKAVFGHSPYRGVSFDRNRSKWVAQIRRPQGTRALGRFDSELQAAVAYDIAAIETHGSFGRLNFPCMHCCEGEQAQPEKADD